MIDSSAGGRQHRSNAGGRRRQPPPRRHGSLPPPSRGGSLGRPRGAGASDFGASADTSIGSSAVSSHNFNTQNVKLSVPSPRTTAHFHFTSKCPSKFQVSTGLGMSFQIGPLKAGPKLQTQAWRGKPHPWPNDSRRSSYVNTCLATQQQKLLSSP